MRRTLLIPVAAAAFAFSAVPAMATDFCVNRAGCQPAVTYSAGELATALDAAFKHAGDDRVLVGAGDYPGSFVAVGTPDNALDVEGAGGLTVITAPAGKTAITASGGHTRVGMVKVRRSSAFPSMVVSGGATAHHLEATFVTGSAPGPAVWLFDSASLEHSDVFAGPGGTGVSANGGTNAVSATRVSGGSVGILSRSGGKVTVRQTTIYDVDDAGVDIESGTVTAYASLVDARGATSAVRLGRPGAASDASTALLDGVTMVGAGILLRPDTQGELAWVSMISSIIAGADVPVRCDGTGGGADKLASDYSNFDGSLDKGICDGGHTLTHHVSGDPKFTGPDDFSLAKTSPLIDAGTPNGSLYGYDINGKDRTLDGNGDGNALRDIGAYEAGLNFTVEKPAPVATTPAPEQADVPVEPITPVQEPAKAPEVPKLADVVAPKLSAVAILQRGRALRVTLSEAATVSVSISRRKSASARWASVTTRPGLVARSGLNRLALRTSALTRGSYRVIVVATDAAGNRSVTKRVSFRVR